MTPLYDQSMGTNWEEKGNKKQNKNEMKFVTFSMVVANGLSV